MKLINTHSHVYTSQFKEDIDEVIKRAADSGINKILLPDIDAENRADVFNLAKKYPNICVPMAGIHPTSITENYKKELNALEQVLANQKVCAVGEIGLDLYWDKAFLQEQIIALKHQIELANKYALPVVIHVRDAFPEFWQVLKEIGQTNYKGVIHCFTGTIEDAQKAIDLGFYLGVGGVITYKNSGMDKIFAEVDIKHLVLETDDPWLTPTPHRGKRNEPSYITYVAQKLADVKEISVEQVAEVTTKNAQDIFDL